MLVISEILYMNLTCFQISLEAVFACYFIISHLLFAYFSWFSCLILNFYVMFILWKQIIVFYHVSCQLTRVFFRFQILYLTLQALCVDNLGFHFGNFFLQHWLERQLLKLTYRFKNSHFLQISFLVLLVRNLFISSSPSMFFISIITFYSQTDYHLKLGGKNRFMWMGCNRGKW